VPASRGGLAKREWATIGSLSPNGCRGTTSKTAQAAEPRDESLPEHPARAQAPDTNGRAHTAFADGPELPVLRATPALTEETVPVQNERLFV
jgi:hypothetical protein